MQARRREDAFRAILRDQLAALAAVVEGEAPCVLRRHCRLRHERRRRGKRLRRRAHFAGDVRLRHGPLDDFEHRLAGLAIEDEQHAGLRCLDNGRNRFVVALDVDQHRLRRHVVVPQVVMHELAMPGERAGIGVQGDQRVRIRCCRRCARRRSSRGSRSPWGRTPGRGRRRPTASTTRSRRRCAVPTAAASRDAVASSPRRRNRIPGPQLLAAAHVECAHDAARQFDAAVVADRGADDDDVPIDRRRRGHEVVAGRAVAHAFVQIDLAAVAEVAARPPGAAVERDQPRIERAHEDAMGARRRRLGGRVDPRRHPARGRFRVAPRAIDPRVVAPALLAGGRIERDHDVRRAC